MPKTSASKKPIKPKTWYRRERFSGDTPNKVRIKTDAILLERSRRANLRGGIASVTTLGSGLVPAANAILSKSLMGEGAVRAVASVVSSAAIGGVIGAVAGHIIRSRKVRAATLELKQTLHTNCKEYNRQNPFSDPLIDFLYRYQYVYVDRYGHLAGTNRERMFGVGRMRISTDEILPLVLVKARTNQRKK